MKQIGPALTEDGAGEAELAERFMNHDEVIGPDAQSQSASNRALSIPEDVAPGAVT